ncbi:hypothetical protein BH11MYX1_BH11MYX1_32710 [soil metagenome]
MFKTSLLTTAFVIGAASAAHAGGQAGSIGVGAEYTLSGIGGVSLNYDAGAFHVGGALGYADPAGPDNSEFLIAGRFFYHVHHSAFADFSLGGQIGLDSVPGTPTVLIPNPGRGTRLFIEPGFEIRAFLSSNVALSANGGFVIGTSDASEFDIGGSTSGLAGGFGIHYYFY